MLVAQAEVVFEVVAVVLQGVDGLVLDLPAGAPGAHQLVNIVLADLDVGHPAEFGDLFVPVDLPVFENVDQQIRILLVERHPVGETVKMRLLPVVGVKITDLAGGAVGGRLLQLSKEMDMIGRLGAENEAEIEFPQLPDVRAVAAERILDHDHRQMRTFPAKLAKETLGPRPLAILLLGAVLSGDHFRKYRDHHLAVRVDEGGSIHLLVVEGNAVLLFLAQAIRRGDLVR